MGTWQQCVYLLKRNYWIKIRNKKQSIQELLFPIYMIAILAMVRALVKTDPLESISPFPCQAIAHSFTPNVIGVSPPVYVPFVDDALRKASLEAPPLKNASDGQVLETMHRNKQVQIGIEFDNMTSYTLRFSSDLITTTNKLEALPTDCRSRGTSLTNYSIYEVRTQCPAFSYVTSGFTALQTALDLAIIHNSSNLTTIKTMNGQSCMFPKVVHNPSVQYLQSLISIYLVMAFSPLVNFLLVNLVTEKEKKIKVGMKMMGLSDGAFWISWFITYGIIMLGTVIIVSIVSVFALFPNSNFFIIFIMFLAYGLSVISFSFMLTPFFNKATAAGGLGSLATILFSILVLLAIYTTISAPVKWTLSLLCPTAFGFGISELVVLDSYFGGADFSNFLSTSHTSFPIGASFLMLVIDIILYWILAFYFDNIVPGEFGQAKPFYFFLLPSYWKSATTGDSMSPNGNDIPLSVRHDDDDDDEEEEEDDVPVEKVSRELESKAAIKINSLVKRYVKRRGKSVTAVNGLNLTLYEGQITALLGHNGAGKSTLIACLTGLTPCSSGGAKVYDLDVTNSNHVDQIRKTTGICPQHDILFDFLTSREHLIVFAGIKGVPKEQIDEEVDKALAEVDLTKHKNTVATKMSGGQKRKLSVAMALIGNPKILFLDEPTSGMDPYSRRQLWSLLQNKRKGKVILLTTHFMDEADILADRKAVLSKGRLQCAGSSLFLKSRFGVGYHLGMVTKEEFDLDAITRVVKENVENGKLTRSHGQEVSYTLPLEDVSSFPRLFASLDSHSSHLGIQSYGVSMTTLEEVFLQLEEQEEVADKEEENGISEGLIDESELAAKPPPMSEDDVMLASKAVATDWDLSWQQFKAVLWIRFLMMIRNPSTIIIRILFPPILVIVAIVLTRNLSTNLGQPEKLSLDPSIYLRSNQATLDLNCAQNDALTKSALLLNNQSTTFTQLLQNLRQSTDTCLVNFTSETIDQFLLETPFQALVLRLLSSNANNVVPSNFSAYYNDTLIHSLPIGINLLTNAIYKSLINVDGGSDKISINNFPFPSSNPDVPFDTSSYVVVLILGIAFLLIPATFATDVVFDREVRAHHQMRVSGLRRHIYWLATLSAHLIVYLIPVLLMLILIPALKAKAFEAPPALGIAALTLFLALPVESLFVYIGSFLFKKMETVQSVLPGLLSTVGLVPYIIVAILYNSSPDVVIALHYIFMVLIPPYAVLGPLYFISVVYLNNQLRPDTTDLSASTYFSFSSHISPAILILIFHIFFLSYALYWLDKRSIGDQGYCSCCTNRQPEDVESRLLDDTAHNLGDDDVKSEEDFIKENVKSASKVPIMIRGLRKEFVKGGNSCASKKDKKNEKVKVAVKNLFFKVEKGEIFGLLGPNGAGKTTSLNVFTGDLTPTHGGAYLNGQELGNDLGKAALSLGYCPQLDALWPMFTLREHLTFYALIKGMESSDVDEMIQKFCKTMKITEHIDKRAKALSGGTKRKLSFLISMVGDPSILLMDEPSTGMDPSSKRFLWNIINAVVTGRKAAVMTTHSMEEADALCSRVGIMVAGSLRCVGSTQHLKDKYGRGYQLEIKISADHQPLADNESSSCTTDKKNPPDRPFELQASTIAKEVGLEHGSESLGAVMDHVKKVFPGAVQIECFGDRATYSVPREAVSSLAEAFSQLEKMKVGFGVEEYSFSQSTLEQVFISFAKQQFEEEGED